MRTAMRIAVVLLMLTALTVLARDRGLTIAPMFALTVPTISSGSPEAPATVERHDFTVNGDPGITLFVRLIRESAGGPPVLMIHGGGPGGLAVFDLDVPGYSLAESVARAGYDVYVMDIRGFGRSTRPASLDPSNDSAPPMGTSDEAVRDIAAVVSWIRSRAQNAKVSLVGHATGGHWAGMYTAQRNDAVSRLALVNSMYGVHAPWALAQGFEDPGHPGTFSAHAGACRLADAAGLLAGWNGAIPVADRSRWREPKVAETYVRMGLATDPAALTRTPPAVCIPGAFRLEHYLMAQGKKFWNARDIQIPVLIVRGERDHWSRREDVLALQRELVNAPHVDTLIIPDATHFFFLDRPEHGLHLFMRQLIAFLRRG
jgi:pimeloyl-ACP methyl ester carboxylesterase